MKIFKVILIVATISALIYLYNLKQGAERGNEVEQNRNELLQKWYLKNNPNNDPNGRQPSEEDLRQIRMAAYDGKKETPNIATVQNNTPSNKTYSSAELFFKENKDKNLPTSEDTFKSVKYNYSIIIPEGFHSKQAKGKHIDFNFNNDNFCTIVANVSQKTTIDPPINDVFIDQYSKSLEQLNSNFKMLQSSVINVDNKNVMVSLQRDLIEGVWMKSIEYYFYHNNDVYIITASAPEDKFSEYEDIYLKTINSFTFNTDIQNKTLISKNESVDSEPKANVTDEHSLKEILNRYYQTLENNNLELLGDFINTKVDRWYNESNVSLASIKKETKKYFEKYPFCDIKIQWDTFKYSELSNGDYSVNYNLIYKIKSKKESDYKKYDLKIKTIWDSNLKIKSMYEERLN